MKPFARPIYYTTLSTPFGCIGLAATSAGICRIELNQKSPASFARTLQSEFSGRVIRSDSRFSGFTADLRDYLSGKPVRFQARVDLTVGTPFQRRVWQALRRIPHGKTRSYRWVAGRIGRPAGSRAVGGACGRNPVPLLIPCHRVINADGRLGGFTGGLGLKERLLALERGVPAIKLPVARQ